MNKEIQDSIKDYIKSSLLYKSFKKDQGGTYRVKGLDGYALTRLMELVQRSTSSRVIALLPTEEIAKEVYTDLSDLEDIPSVFFPSNGKKLYSSSNATMLEYAQAKALSTISSLKQGIIVTSLRAFSSPVISKDSLSSLSINIKVHDNFDPMSLAKKLSEAGYYRQGSCYEVGTYSIRGEVMEIFPFSEEYPVRIYASWDEIEKIALFDPITQKAVKSVSRYTLSLMSESSKTEDSSFTSYIFDDDYLFYVGSSRMEVSYRSLVTEAKALFKQAYNQQMDVPLPDKLLIDAPLFAQSRKRKMVIEDMATEGCFNFDIQVAKSYFGNVKYFKEELEALIKNKYKVIVVSPSVVQQQRIETVLRDYPEIESIVSDISHGFTIDAIKLSVILDGEIFGRRKVKTEKSLVNVSSAPIDSFVDLHEGD